MNAVIRSRQATMIGHGLAAAHRDGDVLDADRDRIAPDEALMQHLDPGALDEAELDQPAFELDGRQRRAGIAGGRGGESRREAALGQSQRQLRTRIVCSVMTCHFNARRAGQAQRMNDGVTLERL